MPVKTLSKHLDVTAEINAVIDYVRLKWTPIENLDILVNQLQVRAFHDWRSFFDPSIGGMAGTLSGLHGQRKELLAKAYTGIALETAIVMDKPAQLIMHLLTQALALKDAARKLDGEWNFENASAATCRSARLRHPTLGYAVPKGWQAAGQGYDPNVHMAEYDNKADADLFQGTDLEAPRTQPLHQMISLPQVAHNEIEHRKKPANTLVSSIYSHFLGVREYLNTVQLVSAIESLTDWNAKGLVTHLDLATEHPMLNVMLKLMPQAQDLDFDAAVAQATQRALEFERMSDEQKAQRRESLVAQTREIVRAAQSPTAQEKAEQQAHERTVHRLLIEAYGTNGPDPKNDYGLTL